MESRIKRLVFAKRLLAVSAMAPLSSMLTSRLLTLGINAAGMDQSLPSGAHTYLPLLNLVGLDWLALFSLLLAAAGGTALVLAPGNSSGRRRAGLEAVLVLAVAQLALYGVQLLVVSQVQGLPDGATALALGSLLPLGLLVTLVVGAGAAPVGIGPSDWPRPRVDWLPGPTWQPVLVSVPAPQLAGVAGRRRGPPHSLLSR